MCVLHVISKTTSFGEFLKESKLPVYQFHEKGDVRARGKKMPYEDYGFSCDVSKREWTDFAGQIEDAHLFLHTYSKELHVLLHTYVVDDIRLDFPYSCRLEGQIFMQCDFLPPEFLKLVGNFGIGIELSHYPPENID